MQAVDDLRAFDGLRGGLIFCAWTGLNPMSAQRVRQALWTLDFADVYRQHIDRFWRASTNAMWRLTSSSCAIIGLPSLSRWGKAKSDRRGADDVG